VTTVSPFAAREFVIAVLKSLMVPFAHVTVIGVDATTGFVAAGGAYTPNPFLGTKFLLDVCTYTL
jgi:hypothetical protein